VFCDWYVELAKPILQGAYEPARDETRATTAYVLDVICMLLHPFMPFLTEELWEGRGGEGVLALAPWPDLTDFADADAEAEIGWVVDLASEIRSARSETNVPAGAQIPLVLVTPSANVRSRLAIWDETIRRLARLSDISFADAVPAQSVQLIVRGGVAALPLAGVVDLAAEQGRLQKELSRLEADITKIEAKLGNADFLRRAPEEVVEEQRERRDEAEARLRKIGEAIARLRAAA
jgi:valyl-tRNA synthetase